jgi:hypothetical protein
MKKFVLFIALFVFSSCLVYSTTLQGGISYTVETARAEAFEGIALKIDVSKHKKYLVDKNFKRHLRDMWDGKYNYFDKAFTLFSNDAYGMYIYATHIAYYYDANGNLESIEYEYGNAYPKKSIKYDLDGNLLAISFRVKENESYVFDINKKLVGHWVDDNARNTKGEIFLRRY